MSSKKCYSPTCPTNHPAAPAATNNANRLSTMAQSTSSPSTPSSPTQPKRASKILADPIDSVILPKLEIHFFYPFYFLDTKKPHHHGSTPSGEDFDEIFGNDGHLLFEERLSAKRIEKVDIHWIDELLKDDKANRGSIFNRLQVKKTDSGKSSLETTIRKVAAETQKAKLKKRTSVHELPFEAPIELEGQKSEISITVTDSDGEGTPTRGGPETQPLNPPARADQKPAEQVFLNKEDRPKEQTLPATLGLKGHLFDLDNVFLCKYSNNIGILRFSVANRSPVGVQITLDLINGLMRLQEEKSERPTVMTKEGRSLFSFHPLIFIEGLLTLHHGEKGIHWDSDKETDRLFVYSMGAISGGNQPELVQKVVYKISQMEDDARAHVDSDYLDSFTNGEAVYKRFSSKDGGIWSTFHVDGGSTLIFTDDPTAKDIPIYASDRALGRKKVIHGTSRPLIGFSLNESLLFRRMFLRRINQELDVIIVKEKSSRATLMMIRKIHHKGLRFRAKFTASKVSTTRAGKEQFTQWDQVMGMENLQNGLQETLSQLNEYYNGIEEKANQKHIDMLTIVLGCLGAISVVIDLSTFYTTFSREEGVPYYLPGAGLAFFLLVALVFTFARR